MNGHLDYDTLADLSEGLLDDARAASAGEHLATCAECSDRSAQLADVSRILAQAELPPLPAELADRIDAAIAAEAAARPEAVGEFVTPLHRRRRRTQWLSAAAAAVVLVGGGATITKIITRSEVTADEGRAVAGDSGAPHRQPAPLSAQGAVPGYRVEHTGTDYHAGTLGTQATSAVKRPSGLMAAGGALGSCVSRVSGGRTPVLVDVARYDGAPATIVVLHDGDGGYDVLVTGCATGSATVSHEAHTTR